MFHPSLANSKSAQGRVPSLSCRFAPRKPATRRPTTQKPATRRPATRRRPESKRQESKRQESKRQESRASSRACSIPLLPGTTLTTWHAKNWRAFHAVRVASPTNERSRTRRATERSRPFTELIRGQADKVRKGLVLLICPQFHFSARKIHPWLEDG